MNIQNEDGDTVLHVACEQGLEDVVSKLLEKGAKVDAVNADGDSALILACANYHHKLALQLIDKADVNIPNEGGIQLFYFTYARPGRCRIEAYSQGSQS